MFMICTLQTMKVIAAEGESIGGSLLFSRTKFKFPILVSSQCLFQFSMSSEGSEHIEHTVYLFFVFLPPEPFIIAQLRLLSHFLLYLFPVLECPSSLTCLLKFHSFLRPCPVVISSVKLSLISPR